MAPARGPGRTGGPGVSASTATGQPTRAAKPKVLGVFSLAMINVAAVLSLRNVPSMAEYGWASLFWIGLGTIVFLVPLALVGAELAAAYPTSTGLYDWVRRSEGAEPGFMGIWAEWVENVVWFPTVMSFVSATLAYALFPSLAANKLYLFLTMVGLFWLITLINILGERWSNALGTFGVIAGSLLPAAGIVVLAVGWLLSGHHSAAPVHGVSSFVPHTFGLSSLALVSSVILIFAGMEMAGYHAVETRNPQRDFPRAMAVSAVLVFAFTALPALAIAIVVPQEQISLVGGVVQAFDNFYRPLGVGWLTRPTALLLFLGAVALVSTWVIRPAKGLQGPVRDGILPPIWGRQNRHRVPVGVIVVQAVLATVFSSAFLLIPGVSGAYWVLSALTTQVLCVMYFLVFTSAVRLRYTQPDLTRPYRIPGGLAGMWVVGGFGALAVAAAFVLGFVPPSQITTLSPGLYPFVIGIGSLVLLAPAVFLYHARRRATAADGPTPSHVLGRIEQLREHATVDAQRTRAQLRAELDELRDSLHSPVTLKTRWLITAVVGTAVVVLAAGFGAGHAAYLPATSFADVEAALRGHGVQICQTSTLDVARTVGGDAGRAYLLGDPGCSSLSGSFNELDVQSFSSRSARDAAVRDFPGRRNRSSGLGGQANVWTYGSLVISFPGDHSDRVDTLTRSALISVGAS